MGDARKLGERNWRNGARNRDSWQKLLKKALAQKGAVVPMMMMMMMTETKFLGLFINNTLSCKTHDECIKSKLCSA